MVGIQRQGELIMHPPRYELRQFAPTGNFAVDVPTFLKSHPKTAEHCANVAAEARRIAGLVGANPDQAEIAGWLHDSSAIYPDSERLALAHQHKIDVLTEEAAFPMILHQKLSVVVARDVFRVTDEAILSAIGCHTTLKKDASLLDKVVFVADKTAWDQAGEPPYLREVIAGLERSDINQAALAYLRYLWERRASLRVVHPWMVEAYEQLNGD